jgi:two-component system CheB/CheR fusion protein
MQGERTNELSALTNGSRQRFLNVLSHELRTPLTPVLAAAELLASPFNLSDAEVKKNGELIRRNILLEVRLLDDLLDLARVSREGMLLDLQEVDVHRSILEAVQNCESAASKRGVTFAVSLEAGEHVVSADPSRLLQVLVNLLSNAAKFSNVGGRVTLRTLCEAPRSISIVVSDSGLGIALQHLKDVFEPFRPRGTQLAPESNGLGLSLAITKGLAEAHGGTLTAESEGIGRGASFTLKLPTIQPISWPSDTEAPAAGETGEPARSCTILLVDDHDDTRQALRSLLQRRGYSVLAASGSKEAKQIAASQPYDLLVSDISMPDGSGLELVRSLKASGVKAIAISGFGTDEDLQKSRDAGFDEHITKPVSFEALESVIHRLLPRC